MPASLSLDRSTALRKRVDDIRPRMAKALNKVEERDWKADMGKVIARCFELAGLTDKEAGALMDRDKAQISRWIAGTERPQFDAIFAVPQLRAPLVLALAEQTPDTVEAVTELRIRRFA